MNEKEMKTEVATTNTGVTTTDQNLPLGFEEGNDEDMIIPRVKIVQLLSPEFKDKVANEGDIINSLTKDVYNDQVFIPCFVFNSNIKWKPRNEGGGMECQARDGKIAFLQDGSSLLCKQCKKNEFDNSKQGRDAVPTCTKYINFFGFFADDMMPVILSFSKTNYNEGKKLFSLAKVSMQNMWNKGYKLSSKKMAKNGNEWHNINPTPAGDTTEEQRSYGEALYRQYRNATFKVDMDESVDTTAAPATDSDEF